MKTVTVTELEAGKRFDKAIATLFPEYSRASLEKLIESGQIKLNDSVVKTKYSLKVGDVITLNFHELDRAVEYIELPIIYEDENVVVINKPIGVLAHTKGVFSKEGTVASWLVPRIFPGSGLDYKNNRAGIVHRLDRGTSGVMIVAKNKETQAYLQGQFSKRNVKKIYVAVISGTMPEETGLIDIPIERNPKKPATFRAGVNGKPAQTEFKVLNTFQQQNTHNKLQTYSLVELKPVTGRTHQLRVHLSHLKHPILGDDFYSGENAERLMLHAKTLEITLQGGHRKVFEAPLPEEFLRYVSK